MSTPDGVVAPAPLLTIEKMHTLQHAGHRSGGIYHIKGKHLWLTLLGNAFSSCGINLLFGLSGVRYTNISLVDPLLEILKEFEDTTPGLGLFKAKRFLIQPTHTDLQIPFVMALLERPECEKLCEYNNLAHLSNKQYLYMLSFGK